MVSRGNDTSLDTLYGPVSTPDWPSDLIVRALREHGEWGAIETELVGRLLRDGLSAVGCRGFSGQLFSWGVAFRGTEGVVAVEANQALIPHLTRNLRQGMSCPAEIILAGVGLHPGWLVPERDEAIMKNRGGQKYVPQDTEDDLPREPCLVFRSGDYGAVMGITTL